MSEDILQSPHFFESINKLIDLRINRRFMEFMRKNGRTTLYHKRGIAEEHNN